MNVSDLMELVRRALTNAGLVADDIDCSGDLAYCGTVQKPHGTDGRYKVHLDFPPTVWLCNYHDGGQGETIPLYDAGTLDAMTEAEREKLRERIRQEKQAALEEREKLRLEAAREANRRLASLPLAGKENAYLRRKGVLPMGKLYQNSDGRLVVPVMNGEVKIVSLQYISGDGGKMFLSHGQTRGCFFPIPAKDGGNTGTLLIGEGAATVLSACMATGYAGLVAFNAGNLSPLAALSREKYPEREIVLLADNDIHEDGKANTGIEAATAASRAAGAKLAICPAIRGGKADFNDLFTDSEDGPERVQAVIEKAREGKALEAVKEPSPMPEEWPSPVPFTSYSLPKLDAGNLPPVLCDFCAGLAEEKQVPVEIAVAMALATLSTAAQWHYVVRIREGYREPLNLYTICPLEPANRKSATVEACLAPLKEWEKWIAETMAQEVRAARSSRLTMEKAIEAKRSKAAHCKSMQEMEDLQHEIMELERQLPEVPVIPRLLADNTTPEALAVLMENMNGCIAIVTAEGGIFDILAGMYSKGTPNLDLFLKAHS
ncbi:MAG: DUF3987 domain-containing protein, partial [Mailhella sp.]